MAASSRTWLVENWNWYLCSLTLWMAVARANSRQRAGSYKPPLCSHSTSSSGVNSSAPRQAGGISMKTSRSESS